MSDLLRRLNIIQDAIALGDEDVIALQTTHLPQELKELSDLIAAQKYADAALWMIEYRKDNLMLTEYQDPEIAGLQMELAQLELALTELVAEKSECLRRISEFNAAYMETLGELLEKILQLRLQREEVRTAQETEDDLKKARHEYEEFKQQKAETPQVQSLDAEQKRELKKLFKQAAHKCHPDQLPDDRKEAGTRMFQELEAAYRKQDLAGVREVCQKLQSGTWVVDSVVVVGKDLLRQRIEITRARIFEVQTEIEKIHDDEIWQLIESITVADETWDDYFTATKCDLEVQLAELEAHHEK